MLKNYIKIAWRNLLKNKGYSILNIGGLAIGMAAAMLILSWVQNERSFDMFHHKKDQLFRLGNRANWGDKLQVWFYTPKPLGPTAKAEFPEIAHYSRYSDNHFLFSVGDKKLKGQGAFVDSAFLSMFDFPLLEGDKEHILKTPTEIVITQSLATRLFGNEAALGKSLKIDSVDVVTVSGVLADMPGNTRFTDVEFLLPWKYMEKIGYSDDYWSNNSVQTYIELNAGTDKRLMDSKIKDITKRHNGPEEDTEVLLHALPDWWLRSKFENGKIVGGRIDMVHLFTLIAIFILLIACINFMNISTARSEKRAKEVGVRKVAGAYRLSLIGQFLSESILIAAIAGVIALLITWLALPAFGNLISRRLAVDFANVQFWLNAIGFILITGLLAGSFPAFFLSSFQPVKVLKGTFKQAKATFSLRKILVVIQFSIAIILIISTLAIHKQIQYAKDRENGYDKNNVVYIAEEGDVAKNSHLIKRDLLQNNVAASVTRSSSPITESWSNTNGFQWEGKEPNDKTLFDRMCADEHIVKTAGLKLVAGRDMDLMQYPTDSTAVLLNEAAVKAMGFKDPIGQVIRDNGIEWHVIGVVADFISRSPYDPIEPTVIEGAKGWFNIMHIKFNPALSTAAALAKTEAIFKRYNPDYPFVYNFVDKAYAQKFKESEQTGTMAALFAFLTIFISCLGLFGLAAYMAENRTKEIGVRKVLGASVFSITRLLSKEFALLVMISCLVAFPIAYWAMDHFLQSYTYRIALGWSLFVLAGSGALLLALLTVSSQAIKAAIANPIDSLRNE
ncbi:ABC transporter permease [Olivibacter sp. XZL3]|uniref:ABC transporter permease n=1 Tax=Olivibacter sp. XZL3 TaxID=1735116 RepID=UPI00106580A3|nr:ABC transporter permease [Olivibacter sp. XZL3]